MKECPAEYIRFAATLAELSRHVILSYFRGSFEIFRKSDASPVTIADRECEERIRECIGRHFPEHGVIGEEYGSSQPGASYQWVIDPVDGTNRFSVGHPQFGCLIALVRDNQPILGLIDMPALDERWTGASGHPTKFTKSGVTQVIHARSGIKLNEAALFFGSGNMVRNEFRSYLDALRARSGITLYDGDCYAYGLVASGTADVVVDSNMGIYDYLPLVAVLEGAGAVITDWAGLPLGLSSGGEAVAAGDQALHAQLLDVLERVKKQQANAII